MDRKDYRKHKSNNYSGPDKKPKVAQKGAEGGGKVSSSKGTNSNSSSSSSSKPYKKKERDAVPAFSIMDKLKATVKAKLAGSNKEGGGNNNNKNRGSYKGGGDSKLSGSKRPRDSNSHGKSDGKINRKAKTSHFDLIEQLKLNWNKIRIRTTTDEVRAELVKSMMKMIHGRVVAVSLRHDASRVVQALFQYGTPADRLSLIDELSEKSAELAKTPYGHFVLLKAINCCTTTQEQTKLVKSFQGHFVALGSNVIGARVVETILVRFNTRVTRRLRTEFYGNKFILAIGDSISSLEQLIKALPAKESAITDHMRDLVQKFCEKGLLSFNYVHDLIWEYVSLIKDNAKRMTDVIELLVDHLATLMETKHGSKVACLLAAHSTAKDRKRMVKSLKGLVSASLVSSSAHLYIMRLLDVVDDTVLVQKSLLDEIKSTEDVPAQYTATGEQIGDTFPKLVTIAMDKYGSKFLLRLLNPLRRHLEPDEEPLFYTDVPTSKKPAPLRRKELMVYLRAPIIYVCTKYCNELLRNRFGCRVISEVVSCFRPPVLINAISNLFCGLDIGDIDLSQYVTIGGSNDDEMNEEEEENEVKASKGKSSKVTFGDDEDEGYDDEEGYDEEGYDEEEIPEDGYEEGGEAEVEGDAEAAAAATAAAKERDDLSSKALSEIPFVVAAVKYMIAIDLWNETGKVAGSEIASIVSDSLWNFNPAEEVGISNLSTLIVSCIKNSDSSSMLSTSDILSSSFLSNNKATGLLVDLSNIPSLKNEVIQLLSSNRSLLENIKREDNENAFTLLTSVQAVSKPAAKSTPNAKQDKKTPSKSAKK